MIRVLFFASVRDRLGVDAVDVPADEAGDTLSALRAALAQRGGRWADVLGNEERVLAAINQEMAPMHTVIDDGDEVAFFPPVTGG